MSDPVPESPFDAAQVSSPVPVTRYQPPPPPIAWLMRLLVLAALTVSALLLYQSTQTSGLPGCGVGSGCDEVLNSPWSKVGRVPAAMPAVIVYGVMLVAMFFPRRRGAWALLLVGAVAALGAAAWFTYVQLHEVGALCKYCLTAHICGGAASLLVFVNAPLGRTRVMPDDPPDTVMIPPAAAATLALVGVIGVAAVAGVQVKFPAPSTRVTLLDGTVRFDPRTLPTIGDPAVADAVVLAVMYDYTCPFCRELEMMLDEARARYGGRLVVVALPVALDADCNRHIAETEPRHEHACELAKLALTVWRADASKFAEFHAWLFDLQDIMTPGMAEPKARQLVGDAAFEAHRDDPWIAERLAIDADLLMEFDGKLPQVLTETIRIQGRVPGREELFDLLETHTSLRPGDDG